MVCIEHFELEWLYANHVTPEIKNFILLYSSEVTNFGTDFRICIYIAKQEKIAKIAFPRSGATQLATV